jgi:hypothetical protein
MKLNTLFIITGILGLFFGLLTLLVPGGFSEFYGGSLTDAGKFDTQLQGAAYLGFAFLLFFVVKAKEAAARKAVVIGSIVHFVIGLIVSLKWQLAGTVNVWGWSTIIIFALLLLGYLYFFMKGVE